MVIFLAVVGAAACCGLCRYGISKAVHRSRDRRNGDRQPLTQQRGISPSPRPLNAGSRETRRR
jgi:hypothetical protein